MAEHIAIVYADASKVIRRVFVSDTHEELLRAISTGTGETALLVPMDVYAKGDAAFRAWVAAKIGQPGPDRCIELTPKGLVVACYHADPTLDAPRDPKNTMALHTSAAVDDVKMADSGEFVSIKPVVIEDKQTLVDKLLAHDVKISEPEAQAAADAIIVEQTAQSVKRDAALAQIGGA